VASGCSGRLPFNFLYKPRSGVARLDRTRVGPDRDHDEQHAEVVAALQQRDCDAAARAMIAHMRPAHDAKALSDFIVSLPKEFLAAEG
jgi:DNA-binding FadR family transcriptional regulator